MPGLVEELQRDAMNPASSVSDLLRKAAVVSRKLGAAEVAEWIALEMGGYGDKEPPAYRKAHGDVMALDEWNGKALQVNFPDDASEKRWAWRYFSESIVELEDLVRDATVTLVLEFPASQRAILTKAMSNTTMRPQLHVPRTQAVRVLAAVRDKILHWSLDLEEQGILGEGLSFSPKEKDVASQYHYTTVTNIGEMNHSQLQQHSSGSQTLNASDAKALIALADAVSNSVGQLKLAADDRAELEAEVATLRSQAASPKPKAGIIRATLSSIKTILEGAAGNVAAGPLLAQLTPLLPGLLG